MNTKSFINKVSVKSPFDKEQSNKMLDFLFDEIKRAVIDERLVEIENIGTFKVEHRKMTTAVNIKKKAEILVPPKDKVVFIPSDKLLKMLNDR